MRTGDFIKEHSASIGLSLRIFDCFFLFASGLLSFGLRFSHFDLPHTYKNVLLLGILFAVICFSSVGCYRGWRGTSFLTEAKSILSATSLTFILLIISGFITQSSDTFSRIWVVTWLISASMLILFYRYSLRRILGVLRARGYNARKVLIIGQGSLANDVLHKLSSKEELGLTVVGYLSDTQENNKESVIEKQFKRLGNIDELNTVVSKQGIDQVWVAIPMSEIDTMQKVQSALVMSPVTIRFVPDIFGFQLLNHSITEVAGLPVINLSTSHMLEGKNRFLKALEDKILSTIILLCISPILLLVALGVKLSSPGPVFYRQERVSWNGRPFDMLKFRSMSVDSEKDGVKWGGATSMSVTKFGAFIRRTSLDELPQFINVLKGDMSIVGPRPERTVFVDQFKHEIPGYMQKHMMKAGITGWAQINGWRGDTDLQKRVECDLYYIENWSIALDIKIILQTIWKGFINKNAA
ncbi:undecaprenyl-phosphate glucose phosphotransferase [Marinomonas spartinae]|nr:undecaprenyl-phosphate glucose phosphotransferase [Marinomonas spartinae]